MQTELTDLKGDLIRRMEVWLTCSGRVLAEIGQSGGEPKCLLQRNGEEPGESLLQREGG